MASPPRPRSPRSPSTSGSEPHGGCRGQKGEGDGHRAGGHGGALHPVRHLRRPVPARRHRHGLVGPRRLRPSRRRQPVQRLRHVRRGLSGRGAGLHGGRLVARRQRGGAVPGLPRPLAQPVRRLGGRRTHALPWGVRGDRHGHPSRRPRARPHRRRPCVPHRPRAAFARAADRRPHPRRSRRLPRLQVQRRRHERPSARRHRRARPLRPRGSPLPHPGLQAGARAQPHVARTGGVHDGHLLRVDGQAARDRDRGPAQRPRPARPPARLLPWSRLAGPAPA